MYIINVFYISLNMAIIQRLCSLLRELTYAFDLYSRRIIYVISFHYTVKPIFVLLLKMLA